MSTLCHQELHKRSSEQDSCNLKTKQPRNRQHVYSKYFCKKYIPVSLGDYISGENQFPSEPASKVYNKINFILNFLKTP